MDSMKDFTLGMTLEGTVVDVARVKLNPCWLAKVHLNLEGHSSRFLRGLPTFLYEE